MFLDRCVMKSSVACTECNATFGKTYTMKRHLELIHKIPQLWNNQFCVICPLCHAAFTTQTKLCEHAQEFHSDHGDFTVKHWLFDNMAAFERFIYLIEDEYSIMLTIRERMPKKRKYRCHLSRAKNCSQEVRPKAPGKPCVRNAKRMIRNCTVFMNIRCDDTGAVYAEGCLEHLGHVASNEFLPLRGSDIEVLEDLRAKGMKPAEIANHLRVHYWDINRSATKQPRLHYVDTNKKVWCALKLKKRFGKTFDSETVDHDYFNNSTDVVVDDDPHDTSYDMDGPYSAAPITEPDEANHLHWEVKQMMDGIDTVSLRMLKKGDVVQLKDIRDRLQLIMIDLPRENVPTGLGMTRDSPGKQCSSKAPTRSCMNTGPLSQKHLVAAQKSSIEHDVSDMDFLYLEEIGESVKTEERLQPKRIVLRQTSVENDDSEINIVDLEEERGPIMKPQTSSYRTTSQNSGYGPVVSHGSYSDIKGMQRSPTKPPMLRKPAPMSQNSEFRRSTPSISFADVDEIERDFINRKRRLTSRAEAMKRSMARSNRSYIPSAHSQLYQATPRGNAKNSHGKVTGPKPPNPV